MEEFRIFGTETSEKTYINILFPDLISDERLQSSCEKRPSDDLVEAAYNLHMTMILKHWDKAYVFQKEYKFLYQFNWGIF